MYWTLITLYSLYSLLFETAGAELLFAGDAMQHAAQLEAAHRDREGVYDYSGCFTAVEPLVKSADFAVVNLETPLGGKPYSGYPMFCAPDTYAKALADSGFDMFMLANNHILDRRDRGLTRTIAVLDSLGVAQMGVYTSQADRDARIPCVKNVNGFRIAFLNYTYGTNGIEVQGEPVVNYIDRAVIAADVDVSRRAGAEFVVVCIHWGDEYKLLPNKAQRLLADWLMAQDIDMVIGGHPHVIQPMEIRTDSVGRKRLLVYSMGNYISNMKTVDTRGGAMVNVSLRRDILGRPRIDRASYRLVFTVPPTRDMPNFQVVPVEKCIHPEWKARCSAFEKRAEEIFDRHNVEVSRDTVLPR